MFEITLSGFAQGRLNHQLFWFMVFIMGLDVLLGYLSASLRGEAVSQKLRDGILRRVYLMILIGLVTIVAALVPEMSSVEVGGTEFYLTNFVVTACIAAEFKSILEKAPLFGAQSHPLIDLLSGFAHRLNPAKHRNGTDPERGSVKRDDVQP